MPRPKVKPTAIITENWHNYVLWMHEHKHKIPSKEFVFISRLECLRGVELKDFIFIGDKPPDITVEFAESRIR